MIMDLKLEAVENHSSGIVEKKEIEQLDFLMGRFSVLQAKTV